MDMFEHKFEEQKKQEAPLAARMGLFKSEGVFSGILGQHRS